MFYKHFEYKLQVKWIKEQIALSDKELEHLTVSTLMTLLGIVKRYR